MTPLASTVKPFSNISKTLQSTTSPRLKLTFFQGLSNNNRLDKLIFSFLVSIKVILVSTLSLILTKEAKLSLGFQLYSLT